MKEFNFPCKQIKLVEISILDTYIKNKIWKSYYRTNTSKSGVRQEDSMSPILFNGVLKKIMRAMNVRHNKGLKLQDFPIELLTYVDDLVLLEETLRAECIEIDI